MVTRKKKTSSDYEADIKRAEARVKELKRKAAQATKAEQARYNSSVLKALQEYFKVRGYDWSAAEQTINKWTERHRQKQRSELTNQSTQQTIL